MVSGWGSEPSREMSQRAIGVRGTAALWRPVGTESCSGMFLAEAGSSSPVSAGPLASWHSCCQSLGTMGSVR